jgi:hypothetical protein
MAIATLTLAIELVHVGFIICTYKAVERHAIAMVLLHGNVRSSLIIFLKSTAA